MWICLNNSFLSIVTDRKDGSRLYVRGRIRGDIERIFPAANVVHTPISADYAFRTSLPRNEVAAAIGLALINIEYDNFKNSVLENDRHDSYSAFWHVMNIMQRERMRDEAIARRDALNQAKNGSPKAKRMKRGNATPPSADGWPLLARKSIPNLDGV